MAPCSVDRIFPSWETTLSFAVHAYFRKEGFYYVHTPIITGSDAEGAGEMFRVSTLDPKQAPLNESGEADFTKDFFGKETNLTVSGQLALHALSNNVFLAITSYIHCAISS